MRRLPWEMPQRGPIRDNPEKIGNVLPPDGHVHSEWSWDAVAGSMEKTCARAVAMGLPSVAFTEHADFTSWKLREEVLAKGEAFHLTGDSFRVRTTSEGVFTPPPLDVEGYRACVQRCRDRFPELRVVWGVELGEPHWHPGRFTQLLDSGNFDRILGSLHSITLHGQFVPIEDLYHQSPPAVVLSAYLAEVTAMIEASDVFEVLAHIDYPIRYWPLSELPFDPMEFEEDYRHVLTVLARSGRALEVNSRVPLHPQIVRWWHQVGGEIVVFGSDAHEPTSLARRLPEMAEMVESCGFRPGRHPYDFWLRT
jgi:histidinol-phosphatase (PHP family)